MFLLISTVILIAALFSFINHKWIKLPSSIGITILSCFLVLSINILGLFFPDIGIIKNQLENLNFSEVLLEVMLAFLLFAGSIHIKISSLKESWKAIAIYSTGGVILSIFGIGTLIYLFFLLIGTNIPYIVCLLFAVIISPTDPIAVIGLLKEAKTSNRIQSQILGESLFNDGTSIVAFVIIIQILLHGSLSFSEFILLFTEEFVGGIVLGLLFGFFGKKLLNNIDHYQTEVLLTVALVTFGYSFCNYIHASGALAMVISGLIIGNSRDKSMSNNTQIYLDKFWEMIDEVLNAILFCLIGLELLMVDFKISYILWGSISIIIGLGVRFLIIKYFGKVDKDTNNGDYIVITWAGLKGGISIALAMIAYKYVDNGEWIIALTYAVVLFSLLIQSLTLKKVINYVK